MRPSPAGSRALRLAPLLACLAIGHALDEGHDQVLFDTEMTPVVREGPASLSEAELALVPAALGVAPSRDACAPGLVHWLTPSVASRAMGSFTRRGAEQVLVSVRFRRCDDVEQSPLPGALVLYEEMEALAQLWRRANVFAVEDVDLDGLFEVVLMTDLYEQGSVQRYAGLWSFEDGEPLLLHDFGEVFADYCGSYVAHDDPVRHTRVTYVPVEGALPDFDVAARSGSCRL